MISQRHNILNLLYKFGMTECKSMATPLNWNLKLDVDSDTKECELIHYYQLMVGSLIYLTITWPNLSYPVSLRKFMQTPRNIHLDYAKRVLHYVNGLMNYNILYKSATLIQLEGYVHMLTRPATKSGRWSTSGFVFSLGSGAISWSGKKELTVALSHYSC